MIEQEWRRQMAIIIVPQNHSTALINEISSRVTHVHPGHCVALDLQTLGSEMIQGANF